MRYRVTFTNNECVPDSFECDGLEATKALVRADLMDVEPPLNSDELTRMEAALEALGPDGGEVPGSDAWKETATVTPLAA